jgi:hypothetical protein
VIDVRIHISPGSRVGQAEQEVAHIRTELGELTKQADFPVQFLPVSRTHNAAGLAGVNDLDKADVFLVYAAGGWMDTLETLSAKNKDMIVFCRHKSGPVYLWYEIAHWRLLRKSEDAKAEPNLDFDDVVVDDYGDVLWRLRALYGLKNARGTTCWRLAGWPWRLVDAVDKKGWITLRVNDYW